MSMTLESRRFGQVQVHEEAVIRFPDGLPGFEELRRFLLLTVPDLEPVQFLVSIDDAEISFSLLPAPLCAPGYAPDFRAGDLEPLGAADGAAVTAYAILTFHHEGERVTANLRAPVLINPATRVGRQVTLSDSTHSLRHELVG